MNNILAPVLTGLDANLPTLIACPTVAQPSTYRALAKCKPPMILQVLRTCFTTNYADLFDELIANIGKDAL